MGVSANKPAGQQRQTTGASSWAGQGAQTQAGPPSMARNVTQTQAAPQMQQPAPLSGDRFQQGHVGQFNPVQQAAQGVAPVGAPIPMQQARQQPMPQPMPQIAPMQPQIAPMQPQIAPMQPQVMPQLSQLGGMQKGDFGGYVDPIRTLGSPGAPIGIAPRTRLF